jgi:hypothetical protein
MGAGPHTGLASIGSVGSEISISDTKVLGNTANLGPHLSTSAGIG